MTMTMMTMMMMMEAENTIITVDSDPQPADQDDTILDDVMTQVGEAMEWMINVVVSREEDTARSNSYDSHRVVMTEDDHPNNSLTLPSQIQDDNLEGPPIYSRTTGCDEVSLEDRQHNCTQCTVESEEVTQLCLTSTLMTQDSLQGGNPQDSHNIYHTHEQPSSNEVLLPSVQYENHHFPPPEDVVAVTATVAATASATVEIENHFIDGNENNMLERDEKEEEEQYAELWLARKKELEKIAEHRAKLTFQSWQRDHRTLEDIIDGSLKEYIELYETAHALRLQFEAEKAHFMSKILALVNGRSLPPGLDSLNFQYDIPEDIQSEGNEDANSRKRSSADLVAQSALSHSMLPQAKKRFVAPKKI
eukprot:scaffold16836_cov258-Ochromonas_danica.AAC.3